MHGLIYPVFLYRTSIFGEQSKQFDFSHVFRVYLEHYGMCSAHHSPTSCFFPPSLPPPVPLFPSQLVEQMISVEESLGMVQQAEDISTRLIRIENSKQSSKSESCVCAR